MFRYSYILHAHKKARERKTGSKKERERVGKRERERGESKVVPPPFMSNITLCCVTNDASLSFSPACHFVVVATQSTSIRPRFSDPPFPVPLCNAFSFIRKGEMELRGVGGEEFWSSVL
jgi:hypothetical protein